MLFIKSGGRGKGRKGRRGGGGGVVKEEGVVKEGVHASLKVVYLGRSRGKKGRWEGVEYEMKGRSRHGK
jgi:hypothetical protein